jgi:hypothetical protein
MVSFTRRVLGCPGAPAWFCILWTAASIAGGGVAAAAPSPRGPEAELTVPTAAVQVEVSAEPTSPYVQSRVRLRVRVLASVPLRDAALSEPVAADALIRRIGGDRRFELERDGVEYRVIERLYALVPKRPGPLKVDPPELTAAVPIRALDASTSSSALLDRRVVVSRTVAPLVLEVLPVPADAARPWLPAESVSISEDWSPTPGEARRGEPLERRVVIEASGVAFSAIDLPETPPVEGLKVYAEPLDVTEQLLGDDLGLRIEQVLIFVPSASGDIRLPSVVIPWWSLGADERRQAALPARTISVAGDSAAPDGSDTDAGFRRRFLERAAADPWQLQWVALILALGWAVTLVLLLRERRRRRSDTLSPGAAPTAPADASPSEVAERFRAACGRSDAKAARDALTTWVHTHQPSMPHDDGLYAMLRARGAKDDTLARVAALDQRLYGAPAGSAVQLEQSHRGDEPWDGATLLEDLLPILQAPEPSLESSPNPLPPLYPGRK